MTNLGRFAFGLDPGESRLEGGPELSVEREESGRSLIFSVPRNPVALGIHTRTETSVDLREWVSALKYMEVLEDSSEILQLRREIEEPLEAPRYFRVTTAFSDSGGNTANIGADLAVSADWDAFSKSDGAIVQGVAFVISDRQVEDVRLLVETQNGGVIIDRYFKELPAGTTEIDFSYVFESGVLSDRRRVFRVRVEGGGEERIEPVNAEREWRPVEVSRNSVGSDGRVLESTLVEITAGLRHIEKLSGTEIDAWIELTAPSGETAETNAREVHRSSFERAFAVRLAPEKTGTWGYRFMLKDAGGDEASILAGEGEFDVYPVDFYGEMLTERPPTDSRLIYSNDSIITTSNWYASDGGDAGSRIRDSVAELEGKGVDIHLITPSFTWVPWWRSRFYPIDEHVAWFKREYEGVLEDGGLERITQYVLSGGDLVGTFVEEARVRGQSPFITFRLNDHHNLDQTGENIGRFTVRNESRFYNEHPEFRLGIKGKTWREEVVLDWTHPEVRAHVLTFLYELLTGYDIDGLELDFLRHFSYFPEDVPMGKRSRIMTEFVRKVRHLLDVTARDGEYRRLMLRIPGYENVHAELGIDVEALADAGVDMMNLSASYYSTMKMNYRSIRERVPNTALYLEMTHTTSGWINRQDLGWGQVRQLTRDEQLYTIAYQAYSRGLEGVSLFNFGMLHGGRYSPPLSTAEEAPLHTLPCLADPDCLKMQPQHYFVARVPHEQREGVSWMDENLRNRRISAGEMLVLEMDMVPPEGGWSGEGVLRFHRIDDGANREWEVRVNGFRLEESDSTSDPYWTPHHDGFGTSEEYRAWKVPADIVYDGVNTVAMLLLEGNAARINYVDLALD